MTEKEFLTKKQFSMMVEQLVASDQLPYMDAIIKLCEDHSIDLEDVRRYLSPTIKQNLEAEAKSLNFLPKGNTLPC